MNGVHARVVEALEHLGQRAVVAAGHDALPLHEAAPAVAAGSIR